MQLAKNSEVYPLLKNIMKKVDKTVFMIEPCRLLPYYQNNIVCYPPSLQDTTDTQIYDHARDSTIHQYHSFPSYECSVLDSMFRFFKMIVMTEIPLQYMM